MHTPHRSTDHIDIHQLAGKLQHELIRIGRDPVFTPSHRSTLLRFINDARVGRLSGKRATRRLSDGRILKFVTILRRFVRAVSVPFEEVSPAQMQSFILGIESGQIRKLVSMGGSDRYTPDTVLDFKKCLRRFYRWLWGDCDRLRELTGWFDTREQLPELRTFDLPVAQRLARAQGTPQGQMLILTLFDSGCRAGEFFNLRLSDLRFAPDTDGVRTCFARVRVSKTKPRTISLPIATDAIAFWVERHPQGGAIGTDGVIQAKDPHAPLVTWTYAYCRKVLHNLGTQELGERLYFHRFRHSSATMWARHLPEFSMCARFGWAMGSRSVRRYVEASGVLAEDTASIMRRTLAAKAIQTQERIPQAVFPPSVGPRDPPSTLAQRTPDPSIFPLNRG